MSGDCGGAIAANTQISITDTAKGVLFENNHTLNHIPDTRAENMARGGAICSRKSSCSISNNLGPIIFNYNQGGKGGAISATQCVISNNEERIVFSNNSSIGWNKSTHASNGGAIQTAQGFTLQTIKVLSISIAIPLLMPGELLTVVTLTSEITVLSIF